MNQLIKTLLTAVLVQNDMRYIHWCVTGEDFLKSHSLVENYSYILDGEIDTLGELAREKSAKMENPNRALNLIGYTPETQSGYLYLDTVNACKLKLSLYINELKALRAESESDVQSSIDEWLRYWNKEVDYKLTQSSNKVLPMNFINTGLDNALAYRYSSPRVIV